MSGGNRPSSWPTKRRGPWAPAAAIPGLGRECPSLDQSLVSLRPRKGESKDEGEETSNSQHAMQCCFSAWGKKNASSKGCPSFLQQGFPPGRQEPAMLMEHRGMIKRDVLEAERRQAFDEKRWFLLQKKKKKKEI